MIPSVNYWCGKVEHIRKDMRHFMFPPAKGQGISERESLIKPHTSIIEVISKPMRGGANAKDVARRT